LLDAVNNPFPRDRYDVIAWDGAIAHFSAEVTDKMLTKIGEALAPGGIFVGSESLGPEGDDHLQVFDDLAAFRRLLSPHWRHVFLRELTYPLAGGFVRREAYWRCSNDLGRIEDSAWQAADRAAPSQVTGFAALK
jgi:SAM-dependent methyltransferase